MIELDLVEISDHIDPTDIVDEIIKQNPNIQVPIPLEEIAQAAGILDIQYKPLNALEGALVANEYKSEGVILVNSNQQESTRKRFTLGHELGHFMIPTHGHNMRCSIGNINYSDKSNEIEIQASDFSSQIIMPNPIFNNHDSFKGEPSLKKVQKLAFDFDVSFEACVKKYVLEHTASLFVVFLENNTFRYCTKNNSKMPFWFSWGAKKRVPVPDGSLSSRVSLNLHEKIYEEQITSSIWLKDSYLDILPSKLIEEVYVQTNGFSVVLLKFESK